MRDQWAFVTIGWVAGATGAVLAITVFDFLPVYALVAAIFLPILLYWLHDMVNVFKHH